MTLFYFEALKTPEMAFASLLVRKLVSQFSSNKESCKKRPLEILRFCITGCSNWAASAVTVI